MTFEFSKFGNGVDVGTTGGNVTTSKGAPHNEFGQRKTGQQIGVNHSDTANTEITLTITAEQIQRDALTNDGFLLSTIIPVGAVITRAIAQVKTAFTVTGTTPTFSVGTEGSEATNGVTLTQAQMQAVGTTVLTLNGTWASPIAAALTIGMALGGTTPVITGSAGQIDLFISYIKA